MEPFTAQARTPYRVRACVRYDVLVTDSPPAPARIPTHVSVRNLPPDVATALHRLAYETGRSKADLIITAIRRTYDVPETPDREATP